MLISFDKTGFPLLVLEGMGVEMHLLPITKRQYEQYLAKAGWGARALYKKMLALNPAVAPADFGLTNRERLFVSGILPQEALAFARWLGPGFDLPTVAEWRQIYTLLQRMMLPQHNLTADVVKGEAGLVLQTLLSQLDPLVMLDLSLMRGGLVEWTRQEGTWVGMGSPRPHFQSNLWNPPDDIITPLQPDERLPYFGFRLLRRGEWYLADKDNTRFIY